MSETPPSPGNGTDEANPPSMRVLAQYLKDHSFENPKAPQSFMDSGDNPAIDVNVDVSGRPLGNDQYEVELSVSARAKRGDSVAFVVEDDLRRRV